MSKNKYVYVVLYAGPGEIEKAFQLKEMAEDYAKELNIGKQGYDRAWVEKVEFVPEPISNYF